jgi:hypothetical protein
MRRNMVLVSTGALLIAASAEGQLVDAIEKALR